MSTQSAPSTTSTTAVRPFKREMNSDRKNSAKRQNYLEIPDISPVVQRAFETLVPQLIADIPSPSTVQWTFSPDPLTTEALRQEVRKSQPPERNQGGDSIPPLSPASLAKPAAAAHPQAPVDTTKRYILVRNLDNSVTAVTNPHYRAAPTQGIYLPEQTRPRSPEQRVDEGGDSEDEALEGLQKTMEQLDVN